MNLKNLQQNFGEVFQLGPINLEFLAGKTYFILGRNGAGKSTLFQMLTGNSDPSQGHIFFEKEQLTPSTPLIKRKIGYLPQESMLPKWSNAVDLLNYAHSLYNTGNSQTDTSIKKQDHIKALLTKWDVTGFALKPIASLSHGMQKRVALCLATFHNPDFLILDEPFTGLDLFHIRTLKNEIKQRKESNKTTLISTHITPYVCELADHISFIKNGVFSSNPIAKDKWLSSTFTARVEHVEDFFFTETNNKS